MPHPLNSDRLMVRKGGSPPLCWLSSHAMRCSFQLRESPEWFTPALLVNLSAMPHPFKSESLMVRKGGLPPLCNLSSQAMPAPFRSESLKVSKSGLPPQHHIVVNSAY